MCERFLFILYQCEREIIGKRGKQLGAVTGCRAALIYGDDKAYLCTNQIFLYLPLQPKHSYLVFFSNWSRPRVEKYTIILSKKYY